MHAIFFKVNYLKTKNLLNNDFKNLKNVCFIYSQFTQCGNHF